MLLAYPDLEAEILCSTIPLLVTELCLVLGTDFVDQENQPNPWTTLDLPSQTTFTRGNSSNGDENECDTMAPPDSDDLPNAQVHVIQLCNEHSCYCFVECSPVHVDCSTNG